MCVAFSIPKHREYLRSGYPSEPILAEAAARQMVEFQTLAADGRDTSVMASILQTESNRGLQHNFSKGCKLTTFIKHPFSDNYANQILNSIPDNIKWSTTFAEAFKDAIVRFTHFGKMADDTGTTTHAMFAAFVRCDHLLDLTPFDSCD
jgi:hypothetical protein